MFSFVRSLTLILILSLPGLAVAEDKTSWLFVISGKVEAAGPNDLTIYASPLVIAFTDRPDRETRILDLETFVDEIWNAGKNDLKDNPPNAAAIIDGKQVEIESLKSATRDGSKVAFETGIMSGEAPMAGDTISLVIDGLNCRPCVVLD